MDRTTANDSSTNLLLRAGRGTYAVFTTMWAPLLLLGIACVFKDPRAFWAKGIWVLVTVPLSVWIYCLLWIRSHRVVLVGGTLSYRTLLGGTLSIPVRDIGEITMSAWSGLRVEARPGTNLKPIIINVPVFAKKDLAKLLDALNVPKNKVSVR